ncbi:DUF1292 domain-containing protein [Oceanirhabdus sp. W0125-5]|uniref:DUF1292 domain-containing protein n=1 Tax=Oceanirhabdus sp. W0125-5 TaxID=2999116 RepID=UPI0022F30AA9|nr:DUF1292 domain-containing protein [Oceanirhabdus sp. W0125-5]WBW99242.1 DUF1292 domain-containing protein [Oceanirhabdus sp. W0125-5]
MRNAFMIVENDLGQKVELELVDKMTLNGKKYVILSQRNSDNAFAYRVVEKNGKKDYQSIGSGEEFAQVLKAYNLKQS